jgi:hypothetical protein
VYAHSSADHNPATPRPIYAAPACSVESKSRFRGRKQASVAQMTQKLRTCSLACKSGWAGPRPSQSGEPRALSLIRHTVFKCSKCNGWQTSQTIYRSRGLRRDGSTPACASAQTGSRPPSRPAIPVIERDERAPARQRYRFVKRVPTTISHQGGQYPFAEVRGRQSVETSGPRRYSSFRGCPRKLHIGNC